MRGEGVHQAIPQVSLLPFWHPRTGLARLLIQSRYLTIQLRLPPEWEFVMFTPPPFQVVLVTETLRGSTTTVMRLQNRLAL